MSHIGRMSRGKKWGGTRDAATFQKNQKILDWLKSQKNIVEDMEYYNFFKENPKAEKKLIKEYEGINVDRRSKHILEEIYQRIRKENPGKENPGKETNSEKGK